MTVSSDLKPLWRKYGDLKTWVESCDAASTIFTIEGSSFENSTATASSESNNGEASSTAQAKKISIFGLIYPSTEPFQKRGLRVEMQVPLGYPYEPPEVYMRMKIRHPNIEQNGRICSVLLDQTKKWDQVSLVDVVKIVVKLMDQPEQGHVVDAEMGSLYDTDITKYNQAITKMVTCHGVPRT